MVSGLAMTAYDARVLAGPGIRAVARGQCRCLQKAAADLLHMLQYFAAKAAVSAAVADIAFFVGRRLRGNG